MKKTQHDFHYVLLSKRFFLPFCVVFGRRIIDSERLFIQQAHNSPPTANQRCLIKKLPLRRVSRNFERRKNATSKAGNCVLRNRTLQDVRENFCRRGALILSRTHMVKRFRLFFLHKLPLAINRKGNERRYPAIDRVMIMTQYEDLCEARGG